MELRIFLATSRFLKRAHCYLQDRTGNRGYMNMMRKLWPLIYTVNQRNHILSAIYCTYINLNVYAYKHEKIIVVYAALKWAAACLSSIIKNHVSMYVVHPVHALCVLWMYNCRQDMCEQERRRERTLAHGMFCTYSTVNSLCSSI